MAEEEELSEEEPTQPYFYSVSLFPQLEELARHVAVIKEELLAFEAKKKAIFQPDLNTYNMWIGARNEDFLDVVADVHREGGWVQWWGTEKGQSVGEWTICPLFLLGECVETNCQEFPKTAELLSNLKGVRVASFSRVAPGTEIGEHKGWTGRPTKTLAFHLGVIIPPTGCSLSVGPQTVKWEHEGQTIVFDDTFTHSAENTSDQARTLLYIDFASDVWNEAPDAITADYDFIYGDGDWDGID